MMDVEFSPCGVCGRGDPGDFAHPAGSVLVRCPGCDLDDPVWFAPNGRESAVVDFDGSWFVPDGQP